MKEKLFNVFLLLFSCFTLHAQVVGFIGKKPKIDYNENLKFEKLICKGDSIIGFNSDYYSISLNQGNDWQSFEYNQTILPYNNIFHEDIDESLFIRGNDLIIFNSGFLISKDFGRSFKRISKNKDSEEKTSFYKGYMFNDNYIGLSHEGLYISKDCNSWKKINTPKGVQVTKFTSSNNEMYIATLKNIYKSVDNGISWSKIDSIVFKRDVETMRSLGGINKIKAFDNKLYIDYYANYDTYVYDLIRKTETKLENVKSVFIKDNYLFVLTNYKVDESSRKILENGKILCYKDSLGNSNIDISKLCETTSPSRSFCGIENFYINSNYIVLDGRISMTNSSNIKDFNFSNIGCISGNCNDGEGAYYFATGDTYKGSWANSQMDGNGAYYYSNGDVRKGVWKNGKNIKVDYLLQNGKISTYLHNDSSNSQNQITSKLDVITTSKDSKRNSIYKNNTGVNEIESKNKEFKLDCFELNQSDTKPSKVTADAFMTKAHDIKTKLNSICKSNGYEVEEVLYQNLRIGYRIEGNENVYIFDTKGLLYLRIEKENSGETTHKYTYNYSGLVVALDIKTKYNNISHSFKNGVTKEEALNKNKDYYKIKVSSPNNDKSYFSDGSKCLNCKIGRYVKGACSQCRAVSRERLNEVQSKRPNCEACRGTGFVSLYNGKRLCTVCKGSGKLTY
ncbi:MULTISPECIES: hypothetical protein [unclassified Flavobacterium]|uniref:WD40/YVTN/BNR-like repeat-containing protein n=1 Tax=unclassified Flavobacterium TaxID=196869 RepID=UPI00131A65C3|nr:MULTISPECIES: hypothetical protein [unclassified Flavobacterium]